MKNLIIATLLTCFSSFASAQLIASIDMTGNTLNDDFVIQNFGSEQISSLIIDLSPLGYIFDANTSDPTQLGGFQVNTAVSTTNYTIAQYVDPATQEGARFTFTGNQFTTGEIFAFQLDADKGMFDLNVFGNDLIGATASITLASGTILNSVFAATSDPLGSRVEFNVPFIPVPTPATIALFALMVAGVVIRRKFKA